MGITISLLNIRSITGKLEVDSSLANASILAKLVIT